jgi:hypothetical protein
VLRGVEFSSLRMNWEGMGSVSVVYVLDVFDLA